MSPDEQITSNCIFALFSYLSLQVAFSQLKAPLGPLLGSFFAMESDMNPFEAAVTDASDLLLQDGKLKLAGFEASTAHELCQLVQESTPDQRWVCLQALTKHLDDKIYTSTSIHRDFFQWCQDRSNGFLDFEVAGGFVRTQIKNAENRLDALNRAKTAMDFVHTIFPEQELQAHMWSSTYSPNAAKTLKRLIFEGRNKSRIRRLLASQVLNRLVFRRSGQRGDDDTRATTHEWLQAAKVAKSGKTGEMAEGRLGELGCLLEYTEDQILQRGFVIRDPLSGPLLTPIIYIPDGWPATAPNYRPDVFQTMAEKEEWQGCYPINNMTYEVYEEGEDKCSNGGATAYAKVLEVSRPVDEAVREIRKLVRDGRIVMDRRAHVCWPHLRNIASLIGLSAGAAGDYWTLIQWMTEFVSDWDEELGVSGFGHLVDLALAELPILPWTRHPERFVHEDRLPLGIRFRDDTNTSIQTDIKECGCDAQVCRLAEQLDDVQSDDQAAITYHIRRFEDFVNKDRLGLQVCETHRQWFLERSQSREQPLGLERAPSAPPSPASATIQSPQTPIPPVSQASSSSPGSQASSSSPGSQALASGRHRRVRSPTAEPPEASPSQRRRPDRPSTPEPPQAPPSQRRRPSRRSTPEPPAPPSHAAPPQAPASHAAPPQETCSSCRVSAETLGELMAVEIGPNGPNGDTADELCRKFGPYLRSGDDIVGKLCTAHLYQLTCKLGMDETVHDALASLVRPVFTQGRIVGDSGDTQMSG